ncbi:MAG: (2Fe-2S)-binding protein [Proteobacteria bacterium]|nr:(2Fe-2S)-binding protein [Desulfobulbaceae bacterium]MBU4152458.1 (2Fe-2S)-binding protein [Pseudomonadota bacterium]
MAKIRIENLGLMVDVNPGLNLLNNFLVGESPIHSVCGGKARCGCCRIKILAGEKGLSPVNKLEINRLGEAAIKKGWRLSCQAYTLRDIQIYMPYGYELDSFCSEK